MTCARCNTESEGYDYFPYCEKCGASFCDKCWAEMKTTMTEASICVDDGEHVEEPSGPGDD